MTGSSADNSDGAAETPSLHHLVVDEGFVRTADDDAEIGAGDQVAHVDQQVVVIHLLEREKIGFNPAAVEGGLDLGGYRLEGVLIEDGGANSPPAAE